jgi:short-subunit dehydrogenase
MIDDQISQFAVITGASSGIGFELARQFAQHDFDLLIVAEDEGIVAAANELRREGVRADAFRADLATYDGVEALYRRIRNGGRPVDVLALNAGVGANSPWIESDLRAELNHVALNVKSVVHLSKRVLADMVARNEGRILFTSSIAAELPASLSAAYTASKAFVLSFAEAIRNELKDTNVRVAAVQAGGIEAAREGYNLLMKGKDRAVARVAAATRATPASDIHSRGEP